MDLTRFIRRYPPLRGGYFLPAPTTDPGHRDFRPLPETEAAAIEPLHVALAQDREPPAQPCVAAGERVLAGQPIAKSDGPAAWLHAPLAGVVRGIVTVATPYAENVPAIAIDADASASPPLTGALSSTGGAASLGTRAEFLTAIRQAGVTLTTLGEFDADERPAALIINGLEPSPYQHATTQMLFKFRDRIIQTADLIHDLFGIRRTYLAVDQAQRKLVRVLERHSHGCCVRVAPVINKYPQSLPPLLIKTILKREIPYGKTARDVGAVVLDAHAIVDMARAVKSGAPLTHRFLTISGSAVRRPGNYTVPLGTSLRSIARAVGAGGWRRVAVLDNPLSGPGTHDESMVITKRTTSIVFFDEGAKRPARPTGCIRSGACVIACPVQLDPRALLCAAERKRFDEAAPLFPKACVDCGLCDYVCPSDLPLMRGVGECRSHVVGT